MSISAQRDESSELGRRESETEMLTGKRGKRKKRNPLKERSCTQKYEWLRATKRSDK